VKQLSLRSARAIATVGYLFAFPLIMRYRHMYRQAIDSSSPTFSGGFGTWLEDSVDQLRTVGAGRPREDVVHSSAWLDLRAEPWWCAVGDVPPDVSFRGTFVDLWGFPVTDLDPGRPGSVLASAPRRVRDVPTRVGAIVRGESSVLQLVTETRWKDPFRLTGTPPVRPEVTLVPASAYLARPAPRHHAVGSWWPWNEGLEATDDVWSCANFALTLTAPNADDRPILEQVSRIGLIPGARWPPSGFADGVVEAIHEGMDDAVSDLLEGAAGAGRGPRVGREAMDRDYFSRALAALHPKHRVAD